MKSSPIGTSSSEKSTAPRAALGMLGEAYAASYLEQIGYRLVAANFILPVGRDLHGRIVNAELDLVAYDGETLCFVEVKTRGSDWFAPPQINVDQRKRRQVARAARAYRQMLGIQDEPFRYDVVTVVLASDEDGNLSPEIELLRNFWREERVRKRQFQWFYD